VTPLFLRRQARSHIHSRSLGWLHHQVRSWDRNGDGMINKVELRQVVRNKLKVHATNDEIDDLFDIFDADHSSAL
jgi:Ca2+-binding EF-hand superfamily protein